MKRLRVRRGVKAADFPDIATFMRAYTNVFGNPYIQCQSDLLPGKLLTAAELYKEIKERFVSTSESRRLWAIRALEFFFYYEEEKNR